MVMIIGLRRVYMTGPGMKASRISRQECGARDESLTSWIGPRITAYLTAKRIGFSADVVELTNVSP